jgi:hypothetical protein
MPRKRKTYNRGKSVRRLARERVGSVPATRAIVPKVRRKKPKHKKSLGEDAV